MAKRLLGIDIGNYSIKLAEFELNKVGMVISRPKILRTPRLMVQDGRITDKNELTELIRQGLGNDQNRQMKAVVLLNDYLVITRDIELPPGNASEIYRMVKLDASEYLPFDISEYTIRYRVAIPADKHPQRMNYVIMASMKNDLATDFCQALSAAGVKLKAIDISINSMMKYFIKIGPDGSGEYNKQVCTALLELGASIAKLVIFQDGFPVFQQIMNQSSQRIDVLIANSLNMERYEAEACKRKYGLNHLNSGEDELGRSVSSIVNNQIDLLLNDIYRSLQGFASRNSGRGVQELWLTGGASMLPGLTRYIQDSFSIPCQIVAPGKAIEFNAPDGEELFPYFTNLAGAMVRGD